MVGETRLDLLVRRGEGDPQLQAVDRLAVDAALGRGALGMHDAAPGGHPIDLAGADRDVGAEMSRCTISPSKRNVTVASPIWGCGRTSMPCAGLEIRPGRNDRRR